MIFGNRLSSFGYLKHFPVDFLKIDGSFVREILHDPIDREMVRSINEIGHLTGQADHREFAENAEIIQMLTSIGVDYAQGYGISAAQRCQAVTPDGLSAAAGRRIRAGSSAALLQVWLAHRIVAAGEQRTAKADSNARAPRPRGRKRAARSSAPADSPWSAAAVTHAREDAGEMARVLPRPQRPVGGRSAPHGRRRLPTPQGRRIQLEDITDEDRVALRFPALQRAGRIAERHERCSA